MKKLITLGLLAMSAYAQQDHPPKVPIEPPKPRISAPTPTPAPPAAQQQQSGVPSMSKEDSDALLSYAYLLDEIRLAQIQLETQLIAKYKATGYSIQKVGMAQFGFAPIVQASAPAATPTPAPPAK